MKRIITTILLLTVLVLAGCGGASDPISEPIESISEPVQEPVVEEPVVEQESVVEEEPAAPVPYWAEVIRWKGSSIKTTETFHIVAHEWRINWATEPGEYGDMNFQIYVYAANGDLEDVAANVIGKCSDVSYVRGAGDYYLTINTGQPYGIIIEQRLKK